MDIPETHYAKADDGTNIAYQVWGDGPVDLVFVPGFVSHLEENARFPAGRAFIERLASFSRLVVFDKRGTGMSDPVPAAAPLEVRMDDLRTVMDAADCPEAALFGVSEGGPLAITFAATYPERVRALVLYGSLARFLDDPPDYITGMNAEGHDQLVEMAEQTWGTPAMMYFTAPSITDDPTLMEAGADYMRRAASPGAAASLIRWWGELDVRDVLPTINVPTLVLHRTNDLFVSVEGGRHLAEHIPGARFVELDGVDHLPFVGDVDALLGEIEEFLTGRRSRPGSDRVLATVLFTDIVASTERAASEGDATWKELLDRHDRVTAEVVEGHRGRLVKSMGDGVLATFDGPARAIRAADELVRRLGAMGLSIRAGLHTGEIELRGEDVGGIAVHIAARVNGLAQAEEVLVSRTVKDLVAGSGLEFSDRGTHTLKGVPEEWQLYTVVDA